MPQAQQDALKLSILSTLNMAKHSLGKEDCIIAALSALNDFVDFNNANDKQALDDALFDLFGVE